MHKSDREISRIQRQIRPVYAKLKESLADTQEALVGQIRGDSERIMDEYSKAESREDKKRLKTEYMALISGLIQSKTYSKLEQKMLNQIKAADEEAVRKIEKNKYRIYAENYNRIGKSLKKDLNGYDFKPINEDDAEYANLTDRSLNSRKLDKWNRDKTRSSLKSGSMMMMGAKAIGALTIGNAIKRNLQMADRQAEGMVLDATTLAELDSMERADDEGFDIKKKWIATLDNRTRESHQELDGMIIPLDEEFKDGLSRPRDPNADPEEIYNCRCDLGYDTGHRKNRTRAARQGTVTGSYKKDSSFKGTKTVTVPNMTYREWQRWRSQ